MNIINFIQDNWWIILFSTIVIIAGVLYMIYPQTTQSPEVIEKWKVALEDGVIIVVIVTNDEEAALKYFREKYPNYTILEIQWNDTKTRLWIKAKPIKGSDQQ